MLLHTVVAYDVSLLVYLCNRPDSHDKWGEKFRKFTKTSSLFVNPVGKLCQVVYYYA